MNIVIYNLSTWRAFANIGMVSDLAKLYTGAPGVFEYLSSDYDITNIYESVTIEELDRIGCEMFKLSHDWLSIINNKYAGVIDDISVGNVLGIGFPILINTLVHHYILLERLSESSEEEILVPYLSDDNENILDSRKSFLQKEGVNWFGLIAQSGSMPKVRAIPVNNKRVYNEFSVARGSLKDNIYSFVLKLGAINRFIFLRVLLSNSFLNKWYNNVIARKNTLVYVFLINTIILSALPTFIKKRVLLKSISLPDFSENGNKSIYNVSLKDSLLRKINSGEHILPLKLAAQWIESYINDYLLPVSVRIRDSVNSYYVCDYESESVFFTNSLASPLEILLAYFFKNKGVPIVSSQHGAIGLLKQYEVSQPYSVMVYCDFFVCFNDYEKNFHLNYVKDSPGKFYEKGVLDLHEGGLKNLTRLLIRKRWNLTQYEKVVLYLPTRFKDGQLTPYDTYDMKYWFFMKEMVFEVFSKNKAKNIIKIHRKGVVKYHEKAIHAARDNPWLYINLPENVNVYSYPQLNYSRYAADILIIDRATSTLGWAIVSGIPVIYINTPHSPLLPNIKEKISKALFLVDAQDTSWQDKLLKYTSMDIEKLKSDWSKKQNDRDEFITDYVLGTDVSNYELADWVLSRKAS